MQAVLDMQCAADFGLLPECACPYQHWHIGQSGCCLDIHFEADGSCHAILFTGDGDEDETLFHGLSSIEQARPLAMAWAAPIIGETP